MGTSCAPYMANIFLHMYEYEHISQLIKQKDIVTATHLSRMYTIDTRMTVLYLMMLMHLTNSIS